MAVEILKIKLRYRYGLEYCGYAKYPPRWPTLDGKMRECLARTKTEAVGIRIRTRFGISESVATWVGDFGTGPRNPNLVPPTHHSQKRLLSAGQRSSVVSSSSTAWSPSGYNRK